MRKQIAFVAMLLACLTEARAQGKIDRKELLDINLEHREISGVKIVRIDFPPGQKAPRHSHPCPVVGQIISGTCKMQVEGKEARILRAGDAFYEPANTPILHFDNMSDTAMTFVAYYLTNGEKSLLELLPAEK